MGPAERHLVDDDHCFKQYAQTEGVPDCHWNVADACLEILGDCLPRDIAAVGRVLLKSG